MQELMNARRVSQLRNASQLDDTTLESAITWLAKDLVRTLGQEATASDVWLDRNDETSHATCRLAASAIRPPFAISWQAVLALKMVADAPPTVRATAFLFSDGDRLGRSAHYGSDYVYLTWDDDKWSAPIWLGDEFGEWESITRAEGIDSTGSLLAGQKFDLPSSRDATPQGAFAEAWTLTVLPDAGDHGKMELNLLGERVGRLVDGGKSYIEVTRSTDGTWIAEGWQADPANHLES